MTSSWLFSRNGLAFPMIWGHVCKDITYWSWISHIFGSISLWIIVCRQAQNSVKAVNHSYFNSWSVIIGSTVSNSMYTEFEKPLNFVNSWHRHFKIGICWSWCGRDHWYAISTCVIGSACSCCQSRSECVCQKSTVWIAVMKLKNRVNTAYVLDQFIIVGSWKRQNRWSRHDSWSWATGYGVFAEDCSAWNELAADLSNVFVIVSVFFCNNIKLYHLWHGIVDYLQVWIGRTRCRAMRSVSCQYQGYGRMWSTRIGWTGINRLLGGDGRAVRIVGGHFGKLILE